jgi:hypothetical protein
MNEAAQKQEIVRTDCALKLAGWSEEKSVRLRGMMIRIAADC